MVAGSWQPIRQRGGHCEPIGSDSDHYGIAEHSSTALSRLRADSAPNHTHPFHPVRSRRMVEHMFPSPTLLTILLALAIPLARPPAAAAWSAPVPGAVTRAFSVGRDPFAAAQHRGIDLAAPPGSPVRAVCGGRVVVAGRVGSNGGVATVACGPWRVTVLPLRRLLVGIGARVRAGRPLGTAAAVAGHAGLHLGVRRAGIRSGYVDPLRFLRAHRPVPRVAPPA